MSFLPGLASAAEDTVKVEFTVSVPPSTPVDATVYLAGNLPAAGEWRADGVALERLADGRWRTTLELPKGQELQYKFTLGAWERVERDRNGRDVANRTLRADTDRRVPLAVAAWASGQPAGANPPPPAPPQRAHTLSGNIKYHRAVGSHYLTTKRDVIVYLPPGYDDPAHARDRYPVLYMHDGQNLFDAATSFAGVEWRLDETAGRLIAEGKIVPLIIVGIYNTPERMTEYTYGARAKNKGRSGEDYLRFIADELKPLIDRTYRTKPDRANTAVGGSSLGGLISLYMASTRPDLFSKAAIISPSLFWDDKRAVREVPSHVPFPSDVKFWVDIGTKEGQAPAGATAASAGTPAKAVQDCRELVAAFDEAGLAKGVNYRYEEVEGAAHNEQAWAQRADRMLVFLFGK